MADHSDGVSQHTTERDTDTRWAHRNLGGPWWLALLLVPLLLAALLTAIKGGPLGDDLTARAMSELKANGLSGLDVDASGRDLTISAAEGVSVPAADLDQAQQLVEGVDGVRVAQLADGLDGGAAGAGAGSGDAEGSTEGEGSGAGDGSAAACEPGTAQGAVDAALGADFVQFGEGQSTPDEASVAEIAAVAELLAPCADLTVTVSGYTDKWGSEQRSLKRAESVKGLLAEGGVTATIETAGGHFDDELGDNETADGRDMNRFATITVK